jgi:hypothetical protein
MARRVPLGGYGTETLEGFSLKKIGRAVGKQLKRSARDVGRVAKKVAPYAAVAAGVALVGPAALSAAKRLGPKALSLLKRGKAGKGTAGPVQMTQPPAGAGGGATPSAYFPETDQGVPGAPTPGGAPSFETSGGGGGGGAPLGPPADTTAPMDVASLAPSTSSLLVPLALAAGAYFLLSRKRS